MSAVLELSVYNVEGKDTGKKIKLDNNIFGIEPNDYLMFMSIKQYLANCRQGTHKSKERSEIHGSTRKVVRQKGSGGARHGDKNAPIFIGGARVFGPKPRQYDFKINKTEKKIALKSALSHKFFENKIYIIENFDFDVPKTKRYIKFLQDMDVYSDKNILLTANVMSNIVLSCRNIQNNIVKTAQLVNIYDIVNAQNVLMTENSLNVLGDRLKK